MSNLDDHVKYELSLEEYIDKLPRTHRAWKEHTGLMRKLNDIDDILKEVNEHGYEDDLTDILDDIRYILEHGKRP